MFIKRNTRETVGKTYVNHLLVESVSTPKGPRHKVVCSLGALAPAPASEWLALAHKIEAALEGRPELFPDPVADKIVAQIREQNREAAPPSPLGAEAAVPFAAADEIVTIRVDEVSVEQAREAGPVHVGHEMWNLLGMDEALAAAGLDRRARMLAQVLTLNRLIAPASEHATPDWVRRTALADVLGEDLETLSDEALYRCLDQLHPRRVKIETLLAERERTLFHLDESFYLYDLTSTYFEGQCAGNPQAKLGYSRDQRPDCKQVVVGLVLDRDGFPQAHEVFAGNRTDTTTVDEMLTALEARTGKRGGRTVVVDRGMAFADNLKQIKNHGHHYLVADRQGERNGHLGDYEDPTGFAEVIRPVSPTNPAQRKSKVYIKRQQVGDELLILCRSEGREEKDRAIRDKQEGRFLADVWKLAARVNREAAARPAAPAKRGGGVHEAIGRLKERYPRVARYYHMSYEAASGVFGFAENLERKARAKMLDGGYLLKTDRLDLSDDEVWKTYILLTRVESAFRTMKSPLSERPIFHQLERRVQAHIFLCVLAYHLVISIEKMHLDAGIHTSWATLRDQLRTHQTMTVVLPASNGDVLKIRRATRPEPEHRKIYETLRIKSEVMKPVKTWQRL